MDLVITCPPTNQYLNKIIQRIWDLDCELVVIFTHPRDFEPQYYWEGYEELCTGSFTLQISNVDDFEKFFIKRQFIITKSSTGVTKCFGISIVLVSARMFTARQKIVKEKGSEPTEVEEHVAQALFDLEVNGTELKADLKDLHILAAKEIEVSASKKAIVVFIPFRQLRPYRKIESRLIVELQKKFSGKHVVFVAQRRILAKPSTKDHKKKQKRPKSRTLTAVHDAILEDMVYPAEIIGKRTRFRLDGSKLLKVYLDRKEQRNVEEKLETFSVVYKKLTGREVQFMFPQKDEYISSMTN
jgi:small subunit ribosomal protein S7e